jgi:4-amino-4-deoxy-L-arabinose transferase-like glycosyltransferase
LVVYLLHGFDSYLSRDLSVYTYAGQQVLDGVPPYVGILNRAGPLAHLLPAVGIAAARALGGPDLLGARVFYLVIAVACVWLVYLLGRDLVGTRTAGLVAAATLLSFSGFVEYAADGPREKTPMVLFVVCTLWALTRRRWLAAGLWLGLATLVLQLAFIVGAPAVLLCLVTDPRGRRLRALGLVVAGGALPVAVATAYFAAVGALSQAVEAFVVINVRYTSADPMTEHLRADWALLQEGYGPTLWVLVVGLVALLVLSLRVLRPAVRAQEPGAVTVASLGVAAVAGIAWTLHDFDSWPDVFTLLPLSALGVAATWRWVARRVPVGAAGVLALAWVLAATGLAVTFSVTQRNDTLLLQRMSVAAKLAVLPRDATMMTVNAPQPLVLSGRTSPTRYLMFASGLDQYVDDSWPGGLQGFGRWIVRRGPSLVAVGEPRRHWLSEALRADYRRVGSAPGWVWYADRDLGERTLRLLRAAQTPHLRGPA